MQGIFISGSRPKSKKAVREAIEANSGAVLIEATSWFGDEYSGPVSDLQPGSKIATCTHGKTCGSARREGG